MKSSKDKGKLKKIKFTMCKEILQKKKYFVTLIY